MGSEAQKEACRRYYQKTKETCRVFAIRLNKEADADVIAALDAAPNKTDYIRSLVRGDNNG